MPTAAQSRCLPATYARLRIVAHQQGAQTGRAPGRGESRDPGRQVGLDARRRRPAVEDPRRHALILAGGPNDHVNVIIEGDARVIERVSPSVAAHRGGVSGRSGGRR